MLCHFPLKVTYFQDMSSPKTWEGSHPTMSLGRSSQYWLRKSNTVYQRKGLIFGKSLYIFMGICMCVYMYVFLGKY